LEQRNSSIANESLVYLKRMFTQGGSGDYIFQFSSYLNRGRRRAAMARVGGGGGGGGGEEANDTARLNNSLEISF
jgi:hypothetical protein